MEFQIERDPNAKSNEIGLLAVDAAQIKCPELQEIVPVLQEIEQKRNGSGFNPNAIKQIFPNGTLDVEEAKRFAENATHWQ